ncbi:DUF4423 domain-containing protein [Candidatus Nomurabacteria bacterium]|nr:DUF4423 domain-containing protein [Candidatus Nomurabacteria bacterium]
MAKKGISQEVAAEISVKLELNPAESSYFTDHVLLAHARSPHAKKLAQYRIEERHASGSSYKTLDVEAFKAISDWHHYAILELALTEDFRLDPKWIAARLGISAFEVSQAIDRLKKLELIEEDNGRRIKKTDMSITATYGRPSAALRKLARQFLQKAIESLDSQSIEERDITNITMAIDPGRLSEAKLMITKFRRKLCAFLEQGKHKEVYVFAPSLFRITRSVTKR